MVDPGPVTRATSRRVHRIARGPDANTMHNAHGMLAVHRIARGPDPWLWTPWQYAPFGGRWDDPDSQYRVLYMGASRYSCFLEALAGFRIDPKILALYGALVPDEPDPGYPTMSQGIVPGEWVDRRSAGTATFTGGVVPIGETEVLAWLRPRVAGLSIAYRLSDLDGGVVRSADRSFTQALSRWLYTQAGAAGALDGVEFESRHGNRLTLWALFERDVDGETSHLLTDRAQQPLSRSDPDLHRALEVHGLQLR